MQHRSAFESPSSDVYDCLRSLPPPTTQRTRWLVWLAVTSCFELHAYLALATLLLPAPIADWSERAGRNSRDRA